MLMFYRQSPIIMGINYLLVVLLAVLPMLSGCSEDKPTEPAPPQETQIPTVELSGVVDMDEIGGTGKKIQSFWETDCPVGASGDFTVRVSDTAAQLVVVTDDNDEIRGLTISVPPVQKSPDHELLFDADATTRSLVFLTPGILTSDPTDAAQRMNEISLLTDYPALRDLLQHRLADKTLAEVLQETAVEDALVLCADEWLAAHVPDKGRLSVHMPYPEAHFTAECVDDSDPANVQIRLRNRAFRDLNVYRRALTADGDVVAESSGPLYTGILGCMPGPRVHDFIYNPDPAAKYVERIDVADLRCGRLISTIEYWISGMGWAEGSPQVPADLDPEFVNNLAQVLIKTIASYMMLPMLEIFVGVSLSHKLDDWIATQIHESILMQKGVVLATALLTSAPHEQVREASNAVLLELVRIVIAYGAAYGLLGFSTITWTAVGSIFLLVMVTYYYTTILGALIHWTLLPPVSVVSISNPIAPDCADEIPPDAVSDLTITGVTAHTISLAWTATGDNGSEGQATAFDVRYSMSPIDETNWNQCFDPSGEPAPGAPGSQAVYTITDLLSDTRYYVGVKVEDEKPNISALSNIVDTVTGNDPSQRLQPRFYGEGPLTRSLTCTSSTPCTDCPSTSSDLWFLANGASIGFPIFEIIPDNFGGFCDTLGDLGAWFGTFNTSDVTAIFEGSLQGDTLAFELRISGTVSAYYFDDELIDFPTSFSGTFTVAEAILTDGQYSGHFLWEAGFSTAPENCVDLTFHENSEGTTIIEVLDKMNPERASSDAFGTRVVYLQRR